MTLIGTFATVALSLLGVSGALFLGVLTGLIKFCRSWDRRSRPSRHSS